MNGNLLLNACKKYKYKILECILPSNVPLNVAYYRDFHGSCDDQHDLQPYSHSFLYFSQHFFIGLYLTKCLYSLIYFMVLTTSNEISDGSQSCVSFITNYVTIMVLRIILIVNENHRSETKSRNRSNFDLVESTRFNRGHGVRPEVQIF